MTSRVKKRAMLYLKTAEPLGSRKAFTSIGPASSKSEKSHVSSKFASAVNGQGGSNFAAAKNSHASCNFDAAKNVRLAAILLQRKTIM